MDHDRQQRRENIARNMRARLTDMDRSAYWLARQVGVTDQHVSRWLNAHQEPLGYLHKIAAALHCTIDDLYAESDEVAA